MGTVFDPSTMSAMIHVRGHEGIWKWLTIVVDDTINIPTIDGETIKMPTQDRDTIMEMLHVEMAI